MSTTDQLQRTHWYNIQRVDIEDLNQDQTYFNEKLKRLARQVSPCSGVAEGLKVVPDTITLQQTDYTKTLTVPFQRTKFILPTDPANPRYSYTLFAQKLYAFTNNIQRIDLYGNAITQTGNLKLQVEIRELEDPSDIGSFVTDSVRFSKTLLASELTTSPEGIIVDASFWNNNQGVSLDKGQYYGLYIRTVNESPNDTNTLQLRYAADNIELEVFDEYSANDYNTWYYQEVNGRDMYEWKQGILDSNGILQPFRLFFKVYSATVTVQSGTLYVNGDQVYVNEDVKGLDLVSIKDANYISIKANETYSEPELHYRTKNVVAQHITDNYEINVWTKQQWEDNVDKIDNYLLAVVEDMNPTSFSEEHTLESGSDLIFRTWSNITITAPSANARSFQLLHPDQKIFYVGDAPLSFDGYATDITRLKLVFGAATVMYDMIMVPGTATSTTVDWYAFINDVDVTLLEPTTQFDFIAENSIGDKYHIRNSEKESPGVVINPPFVVGAEAGDITVTLETNLGTGLDLAAIKIYNKSTGASHTAITHTIQYNSTLGRDTSIITFRPPIQQTGTYIVEAAWQPDYVMVTKQSLPVKNITHETARLYLGPIFIKGLTWADNGSRFSFQIDSESWNTCLHDGRLNDDIAEESRTSSTNIDGVDITQIRFTILLHVKDNDPNRLGLTSQWVWIAVSADSSTKEIVLDYNHHLRDDCVNRGRNGITVSPPFGPTDVQVSLKPKSEGGDIEDDFSNVIVLRTEDAIWPLPEAAAAPPEPQKDLPYTYHLSDGLTPNILQFYYGGFHWTFEIQLQGAAITIHNVTKESTGGATTNIAVRGYPTQYSWTLPTSGSYEIVFENVGDMAIQFKWNAEDLVFVKEAYNQASGYLAVQVTGSTPEYGGSSAPVEVPVGFRPKSAVIAFAQECESGSSLSHDHTIGVEPIGDIDGINDVFHTPEYYKANSLALYKKSNSPELPDGSPLTWRLDYVIFKCSTPNRYGDYIGSPQMFNEDTEIDRLIWSAESIQNDSATDPLNRVGQLQLCYSFIEGIVDTGSDGEYIYDTTKDFITLGVQVGDVIEFKNANHMWYGIIEVNATSLKQDYTLTANVIEGTPYVIWRTLATIDFPVNTTFNGYSLDASELAIQTIPAGTSLAVFDKGRQEEIVGRGINIQLWPKENKYHLNFKSDTVGDDLAPLLYAVPYSISTSPRYTTQTGNITKVDLTAQFVKRNTGLYSLVAAGFSTDILLNNLSDDTATPFTNVAVRDIVYNYANSKWTVANTVGANDLALDDDIFDAKGQFYSIWNGCLKLTGTNSAFGAAIQDLAATFSTKVEIGYVAYDPTSKEWAVVTYVSSDTLLTLSRTIAVAPSDPYVIYRANAIDGTATSIAAGKLTDTNALFETNSVQYGDVVWNINLHTWSYVTSVDSEIEISLNDDIFTSTDYYIIWRQSLKARILYNKSSEVLKGPNDSVAWNALIDTTQDFLTKGVQVGDIVCNSSLTTGGSQYYAKVVDITNADTGVLVLDRNIFNVAGEYYIIWKEFASIQVPAPFWDGDVTVGDSGTTDVAAPPDAYTLNDANASFIEGNNVAIGDYIYTTSSNVWGRVTVINSSTQLIVSKTMFVGSDDYTVYRVMDTVGTLNNYVEVPSTDLAFTSLDIPTKFALVDDSYIHGDSIALNTNVNLWTDFTAHSFDWNWDIIGNPNSLADVDETHNGVFRAPADIHVDSVAWSATRVGSETPYQKLLYHLPTDSEEDPWRSFVELDYPGLTSQRYTVLLLHFDGNWNDDSGQGHAVAHTGATLVATPVVFGSGAVEITTAVSMLLTGLNVTDHNDWYFSSGDFTIESRFRLKSPFDFTKIDRVYVYKQVNTIGVNSIEFNFDATNIYLKVVTASTTIIDQTVAHGGLSEDTWYHIGFNRSGNSWAIYLDGVRLDLSTASGSVGDYVANPILFNFVGSDVPNNTLYVDEYRISKGIARWGTVASFTLPIIPYVTETLDISYDITDSTATFPTNDFPVGTLFALRDSTNDPEHWDGLVNRANAEAELSHTEMFFSSSTALNGYCRLKRGTDYTELDNSSFETSIPVPIGCKLLIDYIKYTTGQGSVGSSSGSGSGAEISECITATVGDFTSDSFFIEYSVDPSSIVKWLYVNYLAQE